MDWLRRNRLLPLMLLAAWALSAPLPAEEPSPPEAPAAVSAPTTSPDLSALGTSVMQVAIEALVVEINENRTRDLGIEYTFNRNELYHPDNILEAVDASLPITLPPVNVPVFDDVGQLGGFALGHISRTPGIGATLAGMDLGSAGRVSASLRALLEQGDAEIRTRPIAVALNGTKVTIETVDEIPFQDVVFKGNSDRLDVKFEKVGVKLHVTPRIVEPLERQLIDLDLTKIEVSGVSTFITVRKVNRPVFVTSSANSRIVLHNAETLVIGGLKSKREVVMEDRIPVLGRIPLLGWLFKSQHKEIQNTDVLFFLTPYILPPGVNPILPFDFEHDQVLNSRQF
ncbi:type II secretion system protein GspD [Candidatus Sumerlaeota bacterium]